MWTSRILFSLSLSGVAGARPLEILRHLCPQRRLFVRAPFAEAFTRLESELAGGNQRFEIGRRPGAALDVGQHRVVNGERQIGTNEISILERPEHGEAAPEARLDHGVHGLGVTDALL